MRISDWSSDVCSSDLMPSQGADGDVIDISLHTVKVQNWDKTISTIPTHRLISESFRNWRGMSEAGGRRIKRSLFIDQNGIRFLSSVEKPKLQRFPFLDAYPVRKPTELGVWISALKKAGRDPVSEPNVTHT